MDVSHKLLKRMIAKCYMTRKPLLVLGTTGIGKSYALFEEGARIAEKENRTLVEWNRISDTEKARFEEDAEYRKKNFIIADVRISQLDPADLRGLPRMNGKDYVEWKPTLLFRVLSLPDVKGILFFDEINLAPPSVQAAAYQIILDKCIGEIAINPDVFIIAAGNRQEDRANVFEMSAPLKNRFTHVTLQVPTIKEWIDWAMDNEVDDRILAYLQFKPSHLMADISKTKDYKSGAFATPRSWGAYLSPMIKDEKNLDDLQLYSSACVGDGVAMEFCAWMKLKEKIDLDKILKHPEQAKGLEIDIRWSLISAVSEKYRADKKILDLALGLCDYLEPDFSASMLRMMKRQDIKHFTANIVKCPNWPKVRQKYEKYIMSTYVEQ